MIRDDKTKALMTAQARFLDRVAPGYRTRRVQWSEGSTQIIEYGEGEPLLLVHGGLGEALQWGPVLPLLGKKHRVLAVDRPGHGMADAFNYHDVDLFSHARRFLRDVIDHERLNRVNLVGSSMGGLWSVAYALQHPEKLASLVLVGAPAGITKKQPLQMRLGALPGLKHIVRSMMLKPTNKSTLAFWQQMLIVNKDRLDEDFLDALTASQARNAPNWFTLLDLTVDFRGLKSNLLLDHRWNELSTPVTFIWGEKDAWASPGSAEEMIARNQNFSLIRIPDAGHAPWVDDPAGVSSAILSATR